MEHYTWIAKNNSTIMIKERTAPSKLAAVRAARKFIRNELYGEGKAHIFRNGAPIETHEKSIFSGMRWIKYPAQ